MSKVFVIDVAQCSGCYSCQVACKDEHCGNDWLPYAKAQPDIGQFWMKVNEKACGTMPKVKVFYTPTMCSHCDRPACLEACTHDAIYKREDGFVIINPEKCVGCKKCKAACPYDAIYFNDKEKLCQKCTGCAHLLDNGFTEPRCVEACPTGALKFGDADKLAELTKGANVLKPETGLGPQVYYRNVPGQFIAGTLYDPIEKEVIIGAKCTAVTGGKIIDVVSDDFGDFRFKDLTIGSYDLTFTAKGYEPKYFYGLRTDECLNLGNIPMNKRA